MDLNQIDAALANPNVQKMLGAIQQAEGVKHGYNTSFGNSRFESLEDHPRKSFEFTQTDGKKNKTSAAGAYQFLSGTWDDFKGSVKGIDDFGGKNQDRGAVWLMGRAGALDAVMAGDFERAIGKLGGTWASLPSSTYAQGKRSWDFMGKALNTELVPRAPKGYAAMQQAADPNWPLLPTAKNQGAAGVDGTADKLAILNKMEGQSQALTDDSIGVGMGQQAYDKRVAEQTRKDNTSLGDLWSAYQTDPRVMSQIALMDHFTREPETVPDGWNYMDNIKEIEGPWVQNQEAVDYLRENVRGPESMQRAHAQLMMRQDMDQVYASRGVLANFAVGGASSMTDIPSYLAGYGTAKLFALGRVGHAALAARGAAGAATGAFMAEAALGNVAVEALLDKLGEVKGVGDYAMAAGMGAILATPFTPGVWKEAALNKNLYDWMHSMQADHVQDQAVKMSKIMQDNPGITPEAAAKKFEDAEIQAVKEFDDNANRGGSFNEQVMPQDVQADLKDVEAAVKAQEAIDSEVARQQEQGSRPDEQGQDKVNTVEADKAGTVATPEPEKTEPTAKSMLEAVRDGTYKNVDAGDSAQAAARYMLAVAPEGTFDVPVKLARAGTREQFTRSNGIRITKATPDWIAVHESVHAATMDKINSVISNKPMMDSPVGKQVRQLNDLMEQVRKATPNWDNVDEGNRVTYGLKNLHEFAAQALSDPQFQRHLNTVPVQSRTRGLSTAWKEFIKTLAEALGLKAKPGYALNETLKVLDQILTAPALKAEAAAALYAPGVNPQVAQKLERKWISRINAHAKATMAADPIDKTRLNVLAARVSGDLVSDGLRMAAHPSELMQLMSKVVTETTTGAAGRGNTAAIVLPQMQNRILGNFLPNYQGYFDQWAKAQGHGVLAQNLKAEVSEGFDKLVFNEIHAQRQTSGKAVTTDKLVAAAALEVRGAMERALELHKREQTAGSAHLPGDSVGYIPQALDGAKLSRAAAENPAAFVSFKLALARQFEQRYGWDKPFTKDLVERYVERQMQRSKGYTEVDHMAAGGNESAVLRDVLDEMAGGHGNVADLTKLAEARTLAQGNLKARLDVFMFEKLGHGDLAVGDFYSQDIKGLVRSYAHRTAGTAALTRHGIPGYRGIRMIEKALAADPRVNADDLKLFSRTMSGILGTPYAGRVVSQGASNLGALVNLQRMGSLVWNQIQEPINMLHHLGLRSVLNGIPGVGKQLGEVGRLQKGQDATSVLRFIESYSGSPIGLDGYRNVAPLDPTDAQINRYADNPTLLTRLLRGGGHLQTKVTGFRRLLAAQHRAVAEQIMLKALRYIREGGSDKYLADMGFTPELVDLFRNELPGIAKWDSHGSLVDFDLTQVSDSSAADAFVNAIHRGTSQIIQDTFVGESNAWVHNDYLRLVTQFRSYGLTAMEKQWARTRMNSGYGGAAMVLMGQVFTGALMHAARTHVQAIGREDREDYIEKAMDPKQVVVSAMNYSSLSGLLGDTMQGVMYVAGGMNEDFQSSRAGAPGLGAVIPAAGSVEQLMKIAGGKSNWYNGLKQLPGSNIWWVAPFINLTKE